MKTKLLDLGFVVMRAAYSSDESKVVGLLFMCPSYSGDEGTEPAQSLEVLGDVAIAELTKFLVDTSKAPF